MLQRTMKLKLRVTILICVILTFCALFVAIHELPTSHDGGRYNLLQFRTGMGVPEQFDQSHIFTFRKRLNKSNYTSENISPEMWKLVLETKKSVNKTVESNSNSNNNKESSKFESDRKTEKQTDIVSKDKNKHSDIINTSDTIVDEFLYELQSSNGLKFNFEKIKDMSYDDFLALLGKRSRRKGSGLPIYRNYVGGSVPTNWELFHQGIHQYGLYSPEDPAVDGILGDMTRQPIVDIEHKDGGTQLKLIFTFSDEGQALFKPMRYSRDQETLPDHFYFVDFERHNAEIAAFHLDRTLGFYRVPPTAGREVNLTHDIRRFAETKLKKTFFVSPANNVCFHGICSYYCDTSHAVCGHPDTIEGSFATFLPPERIAPRKTWRNPWKRSYSKHRKAYWEVYDDLCSQVQVKEPYVSGRRLLDLIDLHIFDFLQGNMDRHHYETFVDFGNDTFPLHLDNGRAFGRPNYDEMSILAPVNQCCLIRYSTFVKLAKLYLGPRRLSSLMRQSMSKDSVRPILTDAHLMALDRRLVKTLKAIRGCIQSNPYTDVIIDDFF